MELILNLVWLGIAATSLALVLPRAIRSRRPLLIVVSLVCALALLFPVVSISDDLSADRDTVEESISIRRIVDAAQHHDAPLLALLVQAFVLALLTAAIGRVADEQPLYRAVLLTPQTEPRSPPRR